MAKDKGINIKRKGFTWTIRVDEPMNLHVRNVPFEWIGELNPEDSLEIDYTMTVYVVTVETKKTRKRKGPVGR